MEANISAEIVNVSDEELQSLTDAIKKRHGIDFSCYEPKSLKRRVARALHVFRLNAVHELWMRILKEHAFIYSFMDEISVGLTAMFRDPVLWRKIRHILSHEWAGKNSLSVWHAGCSTGEEVFTMGIVAQESGFKGKLSAWATDISNNSIAVARKGEYNNLKLVEYSSNYKDYNPLSSLKKYYREENAVGQFDQALINHVNFEHHNLITGNFDKKFDIIFCRNVMIYFDNKAKLKLFDRFHECLNPGGLFIIGFYDAVLPMVDPTRFTVLDMDAKIFRKT